MDAFDRYFGITPDPVSQERFLVSSPFGLIAILVLYGLFVKIWGPRFMKNREPFKLKGILIAYNSFQVIVNTYIALQVLTLFKSIKISGVCMKIEPTNTKAMARQVDLFHMYCMVKLADLLDTVFFVLRKRYKQVTFLHFYHHLMITIGSFGLLRYCSYGYVNMVGVVNTYVHVVMYFYYLMSVIRPDVRRSIWWKKYITLLQILQFICLFFYLSVPLIYGHHCGYNMRVIAFGLAQNIIMLILFTNFYVRSYVIKPKHKAI